MKPNRTTETIVEAWLSDAFTAQPDAEQMLDNVRAAVADAPQRRRRWWPFPTKSGHTPARGFMMFSAVKFITAAAIVALFGGFLLAGVLTTPQEGEVLPAAVTESPEPEATTAPKEPTLPPDPSVRTDILPGVALTVEEVEPGVLWVVNDGKSDFAFPVDPEVPYDIVAGHDGGIYVLEPGHYARLGEGGGSAGGHKGFDWNFVTVPSDVEVAPDGTIWAAFGGRLYSTRWGSGYETRHLPTTGPEPIEVTSDGTVWAVWLDDSGEPDSAVFGCLGADGWTMVGEWPFDDGYLRVSDRGEVWAVIPPFGWGFHEVHRFVDGAWRTEEQRFDRADVGVDGTLWGIRDDAYWDISDDRLTRFDGTEWTTFEPPEWIPTDVAMRELAEDEWVPDDLEFSLWGEPHVAPDGSLWVPLRLGVLERDPDLGGGHQVVCDHGIDGVARFDGETWSRFLPGRCVEAMDIAADGSVWLLASKSDARFPLARTYVITPKALAATE